MNILSKEVYINGIKEGNKVTLSRAITLLESTKNEHQQLAREILETLLPFTGNSFRIGITGVPGVGKSTFIETLGSELLKQKENKIAVLAIDPSSQKSKGSILGDKTRMEKLSANASVFIRPSPTSNELGGVARKTRETILLCEAAGFNQVFIETVGVGQSETTIKSMVDCFLLLMLPGAGDELQGIKRGIMEMADILLINKADGDRKLLAEQSARGYKNALHYMPASENNWITPVITCSAETGENMSEVLEKIKSFENTQKVNGFFEKNRNEQALFWFKETIQQELFSKFYTNSSIIEKIEHLEHQILDKRISAFNAAESLIQRFFKK